MSQTVDGVAPNIWCICIIEGGGHDKPNKPWVRRQVQTYRRGAFFFSVWDNDAVRNPTFLFKVQGSPGFSRALVISFSW